MDTFSEMHYILLNPVGVSYPCKIQMRYSHWNVSYYVAKRLSDKHVFTVIDVSLYFIGSGVRITIHCCTYTLLYLK
jgi:hypothetical protein